ncbi:glycosyltransferase family 2 protein, partial [Pseudomonas aeruginosa]|uniref:glycosyltransferase family 2 protein n=1 Tax=Pseudomonas aeruginosa TaxID=287 RepID=UPI00106B98BE
AIEGHLRARGYAQATVGSRLPGRYELDYGHAGQPPVSILVLAGERLAQLQRCVETVLENTAYPNYEILLLEQGGEAADVREWLLAVEGMGVEQVRVLRGDGQLSRGALRNLAASRARGEFLLWLDAGSGILDKDWLQQLLNHGQRPEVGAVGAKLLAADGRVCHAGWLLGLCGPAGRAFEGRSHEDAGYLQRLQVDQNYSAVAGECLLMRRELFLELGGFNEALTRWDDVDICLRAVQAGYLNVWTPRARLLLDAPATTAASVEEEDALYARWLPLLARDPAYNPGFSLQAEGGFKLADPQLAWRPLQGWRPLPTVLAHPADLFGCGHYRVIQPFSALRESASIDGALSIGLMHVADLERYDPDVLVLQRQVGEERLEAMRRMQAFSRAFKVYELDDYLPNVPLKSAHRQHLPKE